MTGKLKKLAALCFYISDLFATEEIKHLFKINVFVGSNEKSLDSS